MKSKVGKILVLCALVFVVGLFSGCATMNNGKLSASTLKGIPPIYWYTSGESGVTWVPPLGCCQYREKDSTFTMGLFGLANFANEERKFDENGKYLGMKGWSVSLLGLWSSFEEETVEDNITDVWFEKLFLFGLFGYGAQYNVNYIKLFWLFKFPNPANYIQMTFVCPTCGYTVSGEGTHCPYCGQKFFKLKKE